MNISIGFAKQERPRAAALFMQAFGQKLQPVLGVGERAAGFIAASLNPNNTFCARNDQDEMIGIAGFKLGEIGFLECNYTSFATHFGPIQGLWRALLIGVFDYKLHKNSLYLDGICVDPTCRGQGIGKKLIAAVEAHASAAGCSNLYLQVVDTNPDAVRLYHNLGFSICKEEKLYVFAPLFGFKKVIEMVKPLKD